MKILDFYGNKLRVEDISSVATRKAKLSSAADFIGNIIAFLFLILTIILFYNLYDSHQLNGIEAFFYGFFTLTGVGFIIDFLRGKIFNQIYIVEIKMRSGDSHKSHKMTEVDAVEKKRELSNKID